MKWNLIIAIGASVAFNASSAESVTFLESNYNKLGLEVGSGSTNTEWFSGNSNVSIYALTYRKLWQPNWYSDFSYSGQYFHPEGYRIRVNRYILSGGYRFSFHHEWDFFVQMGLGYIDSKAKQHQTDITLSRDDSFLQRYTMGALYTISDQWFTQVLGTATRSTVMDENRVKWTLDYQWNKQWRTGIYYRYRDTAKENYSNEGGLTAYWTF